MTQKKIEVKICKFCQNKIVDSYEKLIHRWYEDEREFKEIYYFCDFNCKMNWIETRGKNMIAETPITSIGK